MQDGLLLYGTFELTIDDKNRLLIPADVRKAIVPDRDGEAFFVNVGINRKPWFYPEQSWKSLVAQQTLEISPGEESLAFDQMMYASINRVEWDKQGRVLVPDKLLKRTGTQKEVTLVGVRNHLELWNRADWAAREEELDRQRVEIALRAKQAKQTLPKE